MKKTRLFAVKKSLFIFLLLTMSKVADAQTATDFNQSGLSNFRTRVIPILNGIVAVFAILGIFYSAYQFFTGDADRGKKFLTSVIIGGVIWFLGVAIVNAL